MIINTTPEKPKTHRGMENPLRGYALEGCIRIGIEKICGNVENANLLESQLRRRVGVRHAFANAMTGTVLVLYDPADINAAGVAELLREMGWLEPDSPVLDTPQAPKTAPPTPELIP